MSVMTTGPLEVLLPLSSYFLGAVPFGLLFALGRGVDLRTRGSGNIGATNVARTLGRGLGLITLLADLVKGLVPVVTARLVLENQPAEDIVVACTGLAVVMGHCYPVFLRFRGGKGVATAAGVFLGVCPPALGIALIAFVAVVRRYGYVSAGSLTAATLSPGMMHFLCPGPAAECMVWAVAAVIWWKHRDNVRRLLAGDERGWKGDPSPPAP